MPAMLTTQCRSPRQEGKDQRRLIGGPQDME